MGMTKKDALRLTEQIQQDAPSIQVAGTRHWGKDDYELPCIDRATGITFTVRSVEDWEDRKKASEVEY